MDNDFQLMVAPLQGLTEAAWRSAHLAMFGALQGPVEYFTPFIRVEKGIVRARDLRDFTSGLNQAMTLTPQIIFRDVDEWRLLVDTLANAGSDRVDMNLGCPFVPQVRKGRGAGMLGRRQHLEQIADAMTPYAGSMKFSVKMRLGANDPSESLDLVDILNGMPLRHIAVHPRTAAQQYKGNLLIDGLVEFMTKIKHPLIFNGEISTLADIRALTSGYAGVMVGRGLLARPSLFAEYRSALEWSETQREEAYLNLIRATSALLEQRLCGSTQLRDKMKPYWDYAPATLDRKTIKQGKAGKI